MDNQQVGDFLDALIATGHALDKGGVKGAKITVTLPTTFHMREFIGLLKEEVPSFVTVYPDNDAVIRNGLVLGSNIFVHADPIGIKEYTGGSK